MSLDSITEQIAHFIGTFELTTEQARLRDQYEEFTALRRQAELEDLADPTRIEVSAHLKLETGEHNMLPYKFSAPQADVPLPPATAEQLESLGAVPSQSFGLDFNFPQALELGSSIQLTMIVKPEFITELIGSAVTYTVQKIRLTDNDTVGEGDFRDVEALMAKGDGLLAKALSLHATSSPSMDIQDYLSGAALEVLIDQMQTTLTPEVEGAEIHQFHGDDALGIVVNGEHVDEVPDFNELLPAHLKADEEEGAGDDTPNPWPAEWEQTEDPVFEDGHSVIAGGNLAVNEVAVTVSWIDAPNILVGGKATNLTVFNQVAVVSDVDEGEPGVQSETHVVQSSEIAVEANEASWLEDNVAEAGQAPVVDVDWISGDMLVTNFIKQVIDATDIDQIATEITATSTAYTLGENVMTNVTDILQLGSFYDMIVVGGDMTSVDAVSQTIVLSDNDVVHGAQPTEAEDNLVMNQVSLTTTGEDTHEELSETLAEVIPLQEVDTEALEDALLNDPMFAGTELVRVLKIEGDLLQVNVIDQVTVLQDDDDVYVDAPPGKEVAALGAGNGILNSAHVKKMGVDSVIRAKEEEYSDLLLHQASIFEDAMAEKTEIISEAVALMMEELDAPGKSEHAPGHNKLTPSEKAGLDDGLETMLA
ncbi:type I secretion protein [Ruegeria atlantica]|uniref:type I secretion protein n=1 Tax=Ruegeria atlantica TaxID=81569 RepID=UPI00148154AE|nr:type I secretion protein [Ruegeria atlantica]